MIDSHLYLTSQVIEDYQQRLRESAQKAHDRNLPHESAIRRRLGQLFISLGEHLQGHRPAATANTADVRLAPR